QRGAPIFHMEVSFHRGEDGLSHQVPMRADVPAPETLATRSALASGWGDRLDAAQQERLSAYPALDVRLVDPEHHLLHEARTPRAAFWVRVPSANTRDPGLQACALTFASDFWLSNAAHLIHGPSSLADHMTASLDHAIWFHRP